MGLKFEQLKVARVDEWEKMVKEAVEAATDLLDTDKRRA
jgi:hypothetical protein